MRLKDFFKELTTIDPEVKAEIEREEREKEKILLKMKMILLKSYFLEKELLALSFEAGVCDVPKLDAEDMECFKFELLEKCLDIRELEKENPEQAFKEYEKLINAGYFLTTTPYDRLAIKYRKNKEYLKEIDILKAGISATSFDMVTDRLFERLQRAYELNNKNIL